MKQSLKLVNLSIILAILISFNGFFIHCGYGDKTDYFNALFLGIIIVYLWGIFIKLLK